MQLLFAPTSPYARKVMVCAHLTGQAGRIAHLPTAAHPVRRDERIALHNPLAKVPTLITEDGQSLYDSRVICEYLASRAGNDHLFPVYGPARWTALTHQALGDGMLDASLLARYELTARPPAFQWPDWREAQLNKVQAGLAAVEAVADALAIERPSIGEVTIGCALGYLDFRFADRPWRAAHPRAAAWFERFDSTPAMHATRPYE